MLSSIGTLGDLFPILELALALAARGQRCHILGSAAGTAPARELGIEYSVIAPAQTNNLAAKKVLFEETIFPSYEPTFRIFEREIAEGNRLVVINRTNHSASTLMCGLYDLPLCRILLSPSQIHSLEDPPMPWKQRAAGPLGKSFRRYQLPKIYDAIERDPFLLHAINAHRSSLGLRRIASLREHEALIDHYCALFPDWYARRASDWPELDFAGFPLARPRGTLPNAVLQLIEAHGPPLVFTPGTGVDSVELFFAEARSCCELMQMPGVFLSPHVTAECSWLGERLVHADFIDLGLLLPHAALLVHHGGIGTTARALQAGIPQIIRPEAYDQPDNAARISELGVGAVVTRENFQAETLAKVARALLGSKRVASTLQDLAALTSRNSGGAVAADLLVDRFCNGTSQASQLSVR